MYRLRLTGSSFLFVSSVLTISCGGGQAEAPPPEAATAPAPVAEAPPAATAPATTAAPTEPPPAPQATAPAAPPDAEKHPHHGRGMAQLFVASLAKLDLKADQKAAVDAAVADLEKQGAQHGDVGKQLVSDIADGVAAGKIDRAKTDADIKKLVEAVTATKGGVQEAVNKLHKALDPAQRKKLVEEMRARGEEMRAKGEQKTEEDPAHEAHLKMLSEALGLSPDQVEKVKAKTKGVMKTQMATMKTNMGAMQKHMKAIGDAFETDKFDAKKVGVGEHAGDMAKTMAKHRIAFVEAVLSVLTPDQRSKFAEHVRAHSEGG